MVVGRAAGVTDTGRRRRQNEDAFVCDPPLFAIADGMGGAQAGELASRLAAAAIEEAASVVSDEAGVVGVVRAANALIFERSLARPGRRRHGDDGHGRARRRADGRAHTGARRRLACIPLSRRPPRAADHRPLARRRARPQRAPDGGRGGRPPAPLRHHARAGDRGGRGGRHPHPRRRARRPRGALLGRPQRDGAATTRSPGSSRRPAAIPMARPRRSCRRPTSRRRRQRHGGRVRARRGRARRARASAARARPTASRPPADPERRDDESARRRDPARGREGQPLARAAPRTARSSRSAAFVVWWSLVR